MDEKIIEQIRARMEEKSTEALIKIWTEYNKAEWSADAFEAIHRVLVSRGESPPPHPQENVRGFVAEKKEKRPTSITVCVLVCSFIQIMSLIGIFLPLTQEYSFGLRLYVGFYSVIMLVCIGGLWIMRKWAANAAIGLLLIDIIVIIVISDNNLFKIINSLINAIFMSVIQKNISKMTGPDSL
jgi:hypothetical protein